PSPRPLIVEGAVDSMTRAQQRRGAAGGCLEESDSEWKRARVCVVLVVLVSWNGVTTNSVSSRPLSRDP
ncbi:hypothetical protein, partial [Bradyrhizobium sp. STM 3809]|uniref:hypothetical protein n=1 Tax=Bradyrhizobium sp. STM 3809 TaxID=551936 RepID=UPI001AEC14ED